MTNPMAGRGGQGGGVVQVRVRRVYEPATAEDGWRVLVDRLWPRGMRKSDPRISEWMPEVAPSVGLRKWYGHRPERFEEFRDRYEEELATNDEASAALTNLRRMASDRRITLLTATRDIATSHIEIVAASMESQPRASPR